MMHDGLIRIWVIGSPRAGRRVLTTAMLNALRNEAVIHNGKTVRIRLGGEYDPDGEDAADAVISGLQTAAERSLTVQAVFRGRELPPPESLDTMELSCLMGGEYCGTARFANICGLGAPADEAAADAVLLVLDGARIADGNRADEPVLHEALRSALCQPDTAVIPVITKADLLSPADQQMPHQAALSAYPQLMQTAEPHIAASSPTEALTVVGDPGRVFGDYGTLLPAPDLMPHRVFPDFRRLYFRILRAAAPVAARRLQAQIAACEQKTAAHIGRFQRHSVRSALALRDARVQFAQNIRSIRPCLTLCAQLGESADEPQLPVNQENDLPQE